MSGSDTADVATRLAKKRKVVGVPTAEGTLYIRGMSGAERIRYFESITGAPDSVALSANQRLIAMQLCKEDGTAAFPTEQDALAVIMDWDAEYVKDVLAPILKASGLGSEAAEEQGKK